MSNKATVIGAGLAGCEAAFQLAKRGIQVDLYEMKPDKKTPAHSYNGFAELVCSNSLRADSLSNAVGLLKEEMRRLDSLIIRCADENKVPAGGALAVDRIKFSDSVTKIITNHPGITVKSCEITEIPKEKNVIIATGPLTSQALSDSIGAYLGNEYLHFFDAAAANAGISAAELVSGFENGTAKISDYPELYNNFFDFIDLAVKYGDDKPLETALDGEESAFGTGKAAMVLGQGAWIEADVLSIDPDIQIGFNGYPVTEDASQCQVISGSDQSLHVNKDSAVLQQTLDFMNWWYTSDYGKAWFTDVAGVVPPIKSDVQSNFEIIKQGDELAASAGAADLEIIYSTDSWHQTFGEIMQSYIAGDLDKDGACAQIEKQWQEIDGAQ